MNILFMGTPEFAAESLRALLQAGHTICGVISQPDRPKNRGMALLQTPVKELALAYDLPVYQPQTLRDGEAAAWIAARAPDLIVVTAYGRILPEELLTLPPMGCVNVHASLLPKYRGAAPINWAILNGERETGVTIMYLAREMDAGDMLAMEATPIGTDETAAQLYGRLAVLGGSLLVKTLDELAAGNLIPTAQNHAEATFAPRLDRALSPVDWMRPAEAIRNQIRGLLPWPAATTELGTTRCKLLHATVSELRSDKSPGSVLFADARGIAMVCGGGDVLIIDRLQADGGKPMTAAEYLRGHTL